MGTPEDDSIDKLKDDLIRHINQIYGWDWLLLGMRKDRNTDELVINIEILTKEEKEIRIPFN